MKDISIYIADNTGRTFTPLHSKMYQLESGHSIELSIDGKLVFYLENSGDQLIMPWLVNSKTIKK